jgi:hypothetical protein
VEAWIFTNILATSTCALALILISTATMIIIVLHIYLIKLPSMRSMWPRIVATNTLINPNNQIIYLFNSCARSHCQNSVMRMNHLWRKSYPHRIWQITHPVIDHPSFMSLFFMGRSLHVEKSDNFLQSWSISSRSSSHI